MNNKMKRYIYGLMKDEKSGIINIIPKSILYITSLFYMGIIKIWDFFYDKGILKAKKIDSKVISIGNITLGGTGKTPFAIFLAGLIKKDGKDVAILIRGYGDDEWRMVKDNSLPLLVGRDRIKSAKEARRRHNSEILILDDGFQHRRLKRDLDIVLVDSHEAFGNGHFFPRGILREPQDSIKRADLVILTKTDFGKDNIRDLRITLSGDFKKHKTLESVYKPIFFLNLDDGRRLSLDIVQNKKICALSAIANPSYFKYILKGLKCEIIESFDYLDHHDYTEKDLRYIQDNAKRLGCEFIVTTEKDAVKIKRIQRKDLRIQILALHIELEITKGREELIARLDSLYSS